MNLPLHAPKMIHPKHILVAALWQALQRLPQRGHQDMSPDYKLRTTSASPRSPSISS